MNRIVLLLRKMTLPEKLGDYYLHLADINSYLITDKRLVEIYRDPRAWTRKAPASASGCGRASPVRT